MPSKPSAKKKAPVKAPLKAQAKAHKVPERAPAPPPEPPKPKTVEERTAYLEARLQQAGPAVQALYRDNLDLSWIAHDSALEGVVYTIQELKAAVDPTATFVGDSSLQPVVEEVRRHREALNFVREYAVKRKQPLSLDVIKKIYVTLHPEEGDVKTVKYRKDIPQHRLYFHEYSPPDKITYKMRQIVDWINDPETHRTRNGIRIAARAHYDIVRVFPFAQDSGKVARLFMNLMLLRSGYPPAIVHSTERQRYYEALKGSSTTMNTIVQDAIENSLASIEKLLDTVEGKPTSD
jgi:Fic family protein